MAKARKTEPAKHRAPERLATTPRTIVQKVRSGVSPSDFQDAVKAARSRFLDASAKISQRRLALALKAFGQNRFARARQVLTLLLEGWQELMILLATDYFYTKMRVMAEKQFSSGAIAWANSQTRSVLDEAFGTNWFSAPEPKLDAVSRTVASWLREIDERLFMPHQPISGPLPILADIEAWDAIYSQRVHRWRGHGWLVTWLPSTPAALNHYVDNPLEPLTDEVQNGLVGDITFYLFEGIERALQEVVNKALVDQACSKLNPPKLLQFVRRGETLVAEPCGTMETVMADTYGALLPYMAQAQSIVRSSGKAITSSGLKRNFKNTYFAEALDMEDWDLLIEEFTKRRPAGCRNLVLGVLSRRTGKTIETVATYTKPSRKHKKTAHK